MKMLCQRDRAKLRTLRGPCQVVILHLLEQGQACLTIVCECSRKLRGCLCIKVGVWLVWIERVQIPSR